MDARARAIVGASLAGYVAWLGSRCPVPSEDGVSYLWMAERCAAGDFAAALSSVFPPGFPLLVAPWIALGVEPWTAALLVAALCAGAIVWPFARIAEALRPGAAWPTVLLLLGNTHLLRVAAEVYSEPPFLLVMAWGTWWGMRGRWWSLGVATAVAFWIRPEGLVLACAFVLTQRAALRALLPALLAPLLLGAWRASLGLGFDPLPLLAFHEQRDDLPGRGAVFANLLDVLPRALEAFGVVLPLALVGAVRARGPAARALRWQIAGQCAAITTFVVRKRFFLSCAVPMLVFAGVGLAAAPRRLRLVVLALAVPIGLGLALRGIEPERVAERAVGQWLATQRIADGECVTDLPRIAWFAGCRPPAPRHFDAAQHLAQAADPRVRWVVLSIDSKRGQFVELERGLAATFTRVELPASLRELAEARGIAVFARR